MTYGGFIGGGFGGGGGLAGGPVGAVGGAVVGAVKGASAGFVVGKGVAFGTIVAVGTAVTIVDWIVYSSSDENGGDTGGSGGGPREGGGSPCPEDEEIIDLGGSSDRIGVIELGPKGTRVAFGSRYVTPEKTHIHLGNKAFGPPEPNTKRIGFTMEGDKVGVVSYSSTSQWPTTADVPAIREILGKAGLIGEKSLVFTKEGGTIFFKK